MWILKITKGSNFSFYVAPYNLIIKYILSNYKVKKINDYKLISEDNIQFEIYLGERLDVKHKDNTLQYRKHR